jgi:hypothetical protein
MERKMDNNLIERARQFEFVSLWWTWLMRYQDDASITAPPAPPFPHLGFGYRAGQFWPRGASSEDTTEEWDYFTDTMSADHCLGSLSINALYCYQQYPSCSRFIDSCGKDYEYPG